MDPVRGGAYAGGLSCSCNASSYDGGSFVSWCRVVFIISKSVLVVIAVVIAIVELQLHQSNQLLKMPVEEEKEKKKSKASSFVSNKRSHLLRYGHSVEPNISTFFFFGVGLET